MATLEDKRNSPFNSFLIDDPTPNNHRITITSEESPTICVSCQQDLRSRSSKILACLHSVCVPCLETIRDATGRHPDDLHSLHRRAILLGTVYTCSACSNKCRIDTICDNLYAADESETNGSSKHCSNCEEGNIADWWVSRSSSAVYSTHLSRYCDNCADWLCLQCKSAHARVRLTKDHTVTQKNSDQARELRGAAHAETFFCQVRSLEETSAFL